jgi:hypothetical protein
MSLPIAIFGMILAPPCQADGVPYRALNDVKPPTLFERDFEIRTQYKPDILGIDVVAKFLAPFEKYLVAFIYGSCHNGFS